MANEVSRSKALMRLLIEQDLANALIQTDAVTVRSTRSDEIEIEVAEDPKSKIAYPWNPADPGAEEFFNTLEQQFSLDEISEHELSDRSQAFFSHLDHLFSANSLQTSLAHKFATVPQSLLNAISRQAQQVVKTSNTIADQLVQCVQEVLPQWAEDDLQVLARPLAYAMRSEGSNAIDATLKSIRPVEWEQLSETEQARMSLAIARYAIGELKHEA